ncbi:MAG: DUF5362 domain-containing protein [Leadbetterella sp.]|nr:DUF5362 domain-containing protein [Leadbetterella sp.]
MNHLSDFENTFHVDSTGQQYLKETARWAKFLAIVGFVMTGFIVLAALFAGTLLSTLSAVSSELAFFPTAGITILYLFVAGLYFFPCLFLFQASQKLTLALQSGSSEELTTAFEKLKNFFRFVGIMTLVIISLYALFFVFLVLGGGLAMLAR